MRRRNSPNKTANAGPAASDGSGEGLPYRVDLWSGPHGAGVPEGLALSANPGVAYAAFYAAARLFPNRHITLSAGGRIISRFNGRSS